MALIPLDFTKEATDNPDLVALGAQAGMTPGERFAEILGSLLSVVMSLSAILLLLYLVWGAVEWIISAGDKGKIEAARNKMMHAIIGILVLSSVLAIFMFVQYILGISVLKFNFVPTGDIPNTTTSDPPRTNTGICMGQNVTVCQPGTVLAPSSAWCGTSCTGACCVTQ